MSYYRDWIIESFSQSFVPNSWLKKLMNDNLYLRTYFTKIQRYFIKICTTTRLLIEDSHFTHQAVAARHHGSSVFFLLLFLETETPTQIFALSCWMLYYFFSSSGDLLIRFNKSTSHIVVTSLRFKESSK